MMMMLVVVCSLPESAIATEEDENFLQILIWTIFGSFIHPIDGAAADDDAGGESVNRNWP